MHGGGDREGQDDHAHQSGVTSFLEGGHNKPLNMQAAGKR
jgi:hypothetical protein